MHSDSPSKILLVILDGFGIGNTNKHNAIYLAKTPFYDSLLQGYPHTTLTASGVAVGILPGHVGTSEVGHMHIGGGRTIEQDLARIHNEIACGAFFENPELLAAIQHASDHGSALHLIGLVSPGGVHSHSSHLYALLRLAAARGLERVYVHAFLDGRDTPPASAKEHLAELTTTMAKINPNYPIATLGGRFYGMDRNKNWDRVKESFNTMVFGIGPQFESADQAIQASYKHEIYDEFAKPCIISDHGIIYQIRNNDALIFFNFRADRMREITSLFLNTEPLLTTHTLRNVRLTSMTAYVDNPEGIAVAYPDITVRNHLSEMISRAQIPQLKIAETEKYAHLTYFFNGGKEAAYLREDRTMIPSPRVKDFTTTPKMAAEEIAETTIQKIKSGVFPFIAINFCNADMIGHTGDINAAIHAIEFLDYCLARLLKTAKAHDYGVIITADHGNAEEMYHQELQSTHTAHTANPVPFLLISERHKFDTLKKDGTLSNVAPTILELMKLSKPPEMTMSSLLV